MALVNPVPVDPHAVNLEDFLRPIRVQETPKPVGATVPLSHTPYLNWDDYDWDVDRWKPNALPVILRFQGVLGVDKTEWFNEGQPKMSVYVPQSIPEFYLESRTLYTNIPDTLLAATPPMVEYRYLTDGIRVKIGLRTGSDNPTHASPTVSNYILTMSGNRISRPSMRPIQPQEQSG